MEKKRLLMLVEIAIFASIGLVLDKLTFSMPQGGSVSFVMLPIVLMGIPETGRRFGRERATPEPMLNRWAIEN